MSRSIVVRGPASAEELAAVIAALHRSAADGTPPTTYEQWRQRRIASLRPTASYQQG